MRRIPAATAQVCGLRGRAAGVSYKPAGFRDSKTALTDGANAPLIRRSEPAKRAPCTPFLLQGL